jgi:hypothetical protein
MVDVERFTNFSKQYLRDIAGVEESATARREPVRSWRDLPLFSLI